MLSHVLRRTGHHFVGKCSGELRAWLLVCAASGLGLSAAGCTVGPDYLGPPVGTPSLFAAGKSSPGLWRTTLTSETYTEEWWHTLNDPILNHLVELATANNQDIEDALERVQIARTQVNVVRGAALPAVNADAGGGWGTGSDLARGRVPATLVSASSTGRPRELTQITNISGFDASWEIDLFGRRRRLLEATAALADSTAAQRNGVVISVIAEVARVYVDLRASQALIGVLDRSIEATRKYVNYTKERARRGITNDLDVTLAERQLATLDAERGPVKAQVAAAKYALAVLCGKFPEDFAPSLDAARPLPRMPEKIGKRLPLELLEQRPDILQAERELAAATALVGVATADLFPRVTLAGGWGRQTQGLGYTPNVGSYIWSLGPSISWALLDFGTLDSLVSISEIQAQKALTSYKATVVIAVREVDTAIAVYEGQLDRVRHLTQAVAAGRRAYDLALERYDRGLTDSLNVIDAQRLLYDLERQHILAREAAAHSLIALYKALGGGWRPFETLPPIRTPQPAVVAAINRVLHPDGGP